MAIVRTRNASTDAGHEQTFTLGAADELILAIARNLNAPMTPVNFWLYPNEAGNASIKVETVGSGRSGAAYIALQNFAAVTVPTTLSLNTQVVMVRITSGTSTSTIDVLSAGAEVTQVTDG